METTHVNIDPTKEVVHIFMNCHAESIKDALTKEVRAGYFETSFYQNLLDNLGIPDDIEIDLDQLLKHSVIENGRQDGPLALIAKATKEYAAAGK